jgi:tetratricopeptide (TPR) repeat protein
VIGFNSANAAETVTVIEKAVALHAAERFEEAETFYSRVPEQHPRAASILYFRAGAALRTTGLDAALQLMQRAAELDGMPAEAAVPDAMSYLAWADSLARTGRFGEAAPCYEIALLLDPSLIEAHVGLGLVYAACKQPHYAAACFQRALRLDPCNGAALLNLATSWRFMGYREAAAGCYREALRLLPNRMEVLYSLGTLLCEERELEEAIEVHCRALSLSPDHAGVLTDLGSAMVLSGKMDEGLALLHRASAAAPGWPVAQVNLGIALVRLRRVDDARAAFHKAQTLDPEFAYAKFCESNLDLLLGDFTRGYAQYDAHRKVYPHRYQERRWDGSSLKGKTILLYAQHGLGDTLQFVRYVPVVAQMGGRVLLQVQPTLLKLLEDYPGAAAVLPTGDQPIEFDVQATLLELPAILGHTPETIPRTVPYLPADSALSAAWAARLQEDGGFRIGIAWHGNPHQKDGLIRSCKLQDMEPICRIPGVTVYSLQCGNGSEELEASGLPVKKIDDLDQHHGPFMDTAAIASLLDLVITIDTSIAHLAGGVGRPVWLALPHWPDWRWMWDRSDSPWYPTMRIFRQAKPFEWKPVFEEMAAELVRCFRPEQTQRTA